MWPLGSCNSCCLPALVKAEAVTALAAQWRRSLILLHDMIIFVLLPDRKPNAVHSHGGFGNVFQDVVNMNSAMNIFKQRGDWPGALELLGQMTLTELEADVWSTNTCNLTRAKSGMKLNMGVMLMLHRWDWALRLYWGVWMLLRHFGEILKIAPTCTDFEDSRHWNLAMIIHKSPKVVENSAWLILIVACTRHHCRWLQ